MMSIAEAIQAQGLTQAQAAEVFGVTQPRIADLVRGKVGLFSLDALVDMASTAGVNPTIKVTVPKKASAKASVGKTAPVPAQAPAPAPKPTAGKGRAASVPAA